MDPFEYQNQLSMARQREQEQEQEQESSPIGEAASELKNQAKKEIKRQIYLWLASIAAAVFPYALLVFAVLIVWYCACTNVTGGFKGWVVSISMKSAGLCPAGLGSGYPQNSASLTQDACTEEDLTSGGCIIEVSGYSSTTDQTDSDPFIAAYRNTRVHVGMLAANFLDFTTKVKFPGVFGDQIFTVEDRMNRRYVNNMDIWFETREEALQFGRKKFTCNKTGEVIMCL